MAEDVHHLNRQRDIAISYIHKINNLVSKYIRIISQQEESEKKNPLRAVNFYKPDSFDSEKHPTLFGTPLKD